MLEDIIKKNSFNEPAKKTVTKEIKSLVKLIRGECSRLSLQKILEVDNLNLFYTYYLNASIEAGLIEKTNPEKPQIASQKYRLTNKGLTLQKKLLKGKNKK